MAKYIAKLLFVDDETEQLEVYRNFFARRNFRVFIAASAEEGLLAIKKDRPDLVFLDMKLSSNMNGKDVLEALRKTNTDTKVVIITGDILNYDNTKELSSLGVIRVMHKPVSLEAVEETIKTALQEKYFQPAPQEEINASSDHNENSLRRVNHELANITNEICSKCELYLLNSEDGFYHGKSAQERLEIADEAIASVFRASERLKNIIEKISDMVKKKI